MTRMALHLGLAFTAASTSAQAIAQAPGPARIVWNLDWQESHCTITTGAADTLGLSFWMTPGDPDPELYVVGPDMLPGRVGEKVTVALAPGGETFQAEIAQMSNGAKAHVLELSKLRHKFPPAFAKADALRLITSEGQLVVPTKGAGKAMGALQQCIDLKLAEWGVDPKIYVALRQPPTRRDDAEVVTPDDYPQAALDHNESGDVVARLAVDATGRVTDCAVVVRSGSAALDAATCRAGKKAKFDPAIGPDGQPVAAVRVLNVKWQIM